jgi:hypothetical protein
MPGPLTLYLILSIYLYLYLLLCNDRILSAHCLLLRPICYILLAETNDADPSTRSFSYLGARVT